MTDENKKELETKIVDLEKSLSKLKKKLNEEQIEEQHEAIDNLDVYLDEIDHKYSNLRDFCSIIGTEIKEFFIKRSKDSSEN